MGRADCVFCAIVAGTSPARVVHDDERTLAFLDIAALTRGHILVVPKRHSENLLDIRTEDVVAVSLAVRHVSRRAMEVLRADGINLIQATGEAAQQTVFHFHMHVLPRYVGEGLPLEEGFLKRTPTDPADLDEIAGLFANPGQ